MAAAYFMVHFPQSFFPAKNFGEPAVLFVFGALTVTVPVAAKLMVTVVKIKIGRNFLIPDSPACFSNAIALVRKSANSHSERASTRARANRENIPMLWTQPPIPEIARLG